MTDQQRAALAAWDRAVELWRSGSPFLALWYYSDFLHYMEGWRFGALDLGDVANGA